MSISICCWWKPDERPTAAEVRTVLTDYLGGCGAVVAGRPRFDEDLVVYLPGVPTHPFRSKSQVLAASPPPRPERAFEVLWLDDHLDVVVRQQDEFTLVVADGFARLVCRYWKARFDDGGHTNLDGS